MAGLAAGGSAGWSLRARQFENNIQFEPMSGCWLWNGPDTGDGYGGWVHRGRYRPAHRAAYELYVGPIPPNMEIDHLCRVRCCVNPAHLEPVSHSENLRRAHRWRDGARHRNFKERFGVALAARLDHRPTSSVKYLAAALAFTASRSVYHHLSGRCCPSADMLDAYLGYYIDRGDFSFLAEIFPGTRPLVRKAEAFDAARRALALDPHGTHGADGMAAPRGGRAGSAPHSGPGAAVASRKRA